MNKKMVNDGEQVTQNDIARAAGVSRVTVSRAFTDPGRVSESTRRRVMQVAARLGYEHPTTQPGFQPNLRRIALLRIDDLNPADWTQRHVAGRLHESVIETAAAKGILVISGHVGPEGNLSEALQQYAAEAEGIIAPIQKTPPPQVVEELSRSSVPVVVLNRTAYGGSHLSSIALDNHRSGQMATEALHRLGHRRIAFVGGEPQAISSEVLTQRLGGYIQAALTAGCYDPRLVLLEAGYQQELEKLLREESLTGVVCVNDATAYSVVSYLLRAGYDIPADVSIIGHDYISGFFEADLEVSSISFREKRFAELSFTVLELARQRPTQPIHLLVEPRLMPGDTVKQCTN